MFGGMNIQSQTLVIDSDPGSAAEPFYLMRAPEGGLTVRGVYMTAEQAQNAGTAVVLMLQNWGTAGTAVKSGGTVAAGIGGTASGARLSARTPAAGTVDSDQKYIAEGEWLVAGYAEEGTGWIANDRFTFQVDYVLGKGA